MHRAYLLYGQVGSEFGAVSLQVQQLMRLTPAVKSEESTVNSKLTAEHTEDGENRKIKNQKDSKKNEKMSKFLLGIF